MASSGNRTELIVSLSRRVRQYSLPPLKPSDEHGDETENIVSLQTVINVYHKCDKSLQIKQYQIIQCMYMRPMGWSGYTPPLK